MRVAIVHYHLQPGGVTRVIESASQVLTAASVPHVILCSEVIPALGYLTSTTTTVAELTDSLITAATEALGGAPDLWHFHNHSLGKNILIPGVISQLAATGARLVLQIHDLAEQGRPDNFPLIADCPELHPFSPRIRYAFLNSRDLKRFTNAGLPAGNASLLANPILPRTCHPASSAPPILFAPIRGIRRKNLGELILLATLAPSGTRLAISRQPTNPLARPVHDTWQKFTEKLRLPVEFDVVDRSVPATHSSSSFDSWVAHATHFVTTSVSEGFGLPFLEAAAYGKPLIGRNLSHLTTEFAAHGIRCGRLYDRILVPLDWVDSQLLEDHLASTLERNFRLYRRRFTAEMLEEALSVIVHEERVDFGNLPEALQQGVIERVRRPDSRSLLEVEVSGEIQSLESWLATAIAERKPTATPAQLAPYSLAIYQEKLTSLYASLLEEPATPLAHVDPAAVLTAHLAPQAFHFLLSALRPEPPPLAENFRAVIFDIYGTLLHAPFCRVQPDPVADPLLREIIASHGHTPPESPSTALHTAILRHHELSNVPFPEVDLRVLWRKILLVEQGHDLEPLIAEIETTWHPSSLMPGAGQAIQRLARSGVSLGLLSNAQCNTLPTLESLADFFAPELCLLSYQHGIAKPAPELFQMMVERLAGRGISPAETLYIGDDTAHDILPATTVGFRTALFTGQSARKSLGDAAPDFTLPSWHALGQIV
jgi:FMN phosphatase YigB (HAD superfamily)/glycosyltransferase involved in cell wall biosynthesis